MAEEKLQVPPVIYDEMRYKHRPMEDGERPFYPREVIPPGNLPFDPGDGGGITIDPDTGNIKINIDELISKDAPNPLGLGSDGKLLVQLLELVNNILSGKQPNGLTIDENGQLIVDPKDLISSQEGNKLRVGNDGRLYTSGGDLVSGEGGNQLQVRGDGSLYVATPTHPRDWIYYGRGALQEGQAWGQDKMIYCQIN